MNNQFFFTVCKGVELHYTIIRGSCLGLWPPEKSRFRERLPDEVDITLPSASLPTLRSFPARPAVSAYVCQEEAIRILYSLFPHTPGSQHS